MSTDIFNKATTASSTSKSSQDMILRPSTSAHETSPGLEKEERSSSDSEEDSAEQDSFEKLEPQNSSSEEESNELLDPVQKNIPLTRSVCDVVYHQDFGYIKFYLIARKAIVTDALRTKIVVRGSTYFQNSSGPFAQKNKRSMTSSRLKKRLRKGEGEVNWSWLVYSPVKGAAFCFSCLLFPSKDAVSHNSLETEKGFNNWKSPDKITVHENSSRHWNSFTTWKKI